MDYLNKKILPLEIENIILGYIADLDHHNKFKQSLVQIESISREPNVNRSDNHARGGITLYYDSCNLCIILIICNDCGEYFINRKFCGCNWFFKHSTYNKNPRCEFSNYLWG